MNGGSNKKNMKKKIKEFIKIQHQLQDEYLNQNNFSFSLFLGTFYQFGIND